MKEYIGVKIIKAEPMSREDAESHLGRNVGGIKSGDGYLVEYEGEDKYQAWSPKDVFEEAYQEAYLEDGFNFDYDKSKVTEDHQVRVVKEFDELFKKLIDLSKFVKTEFFNTLPEDEQLRLGKQLRVMIMYRDILYDRICNFN